MKRVRIQVESVLRLGAPLSLEARVLSTYTPAQDQLRRQIDKHVGIPVRSLVYDYLWDTFVRPDLSTKEL